MWGRPWPRPWVGHGVSHGLSYGLTVVNFIKQFTFESLKILIIIKHKCEQIASY